jgi:hypothetical protein
MLKSPKAVNPRLEGTFQVHELSPIPELLNLDEQRIHLVLKLIDPIIKFVFNRFDDPSVVSIDSMNHSSSCSFVGIVSSSRLQAEVLLH